MSCMLCSHVSIFGGTKFIEQQCIRTSTTTQQIPTQGSLQERNSSFQSRVDYNLQQRKHNRRWKRVSIQATNLKEDEAPSKETSETPPVASPTDFIKWGGTLPSRRRLLYSGLTGVAVTLGGNLGGVTSGLLGLNVETSRNLRLDTLFPIKGFKRCVEADQGFEFIYPSDWLGDQRLLYRAVERAEQSRSLDLPPIRRSSGRDRTEPIVAFGPAAGSGELNVSVVVAPIAPGFRLQSLGTPAEAGQKILDNVIAREGSGKTADLLAAESSPDNKYYTLEYTVRTTEWYRHNVSVYATQNNQLYSINVMCPESKWQERKEQLRTTATSFRLTKSLPVDTFAQRL